MMLASRVLSVLPFAFLLLQVVLAQPRGPQQPTEAADVPVAPFDIQYLLNGVTAWSIVTGGVPNPSYTRKLALATKIPIPFELNSLDISVDAKGPAIEIVSISNTFKDLDSTGAEGMVTLVLVFFS